MWKLDLTVSNSFLCYSYNILILGTIKQKILHALALSGRSALSVGHFFSSRLGLERPRLSRESEASYMRQEPVSLDF